jgi:DNA-binding PadR family transcriptional regulator
VSRAGRDDVRADAPRREPERRADAERTDRRPQLPTDRLTLPRSERRETVEFRDRTYRLRGSESRLLATVGAFRVVPETDLSGGRSNSSSTVREDLRRLANQGLVVSRTLPINREPTRVAVLTREGKALLDDRRRGSDRPRQEFHAGLVKPRELAHDAQLYRLYQAEASRLEDAGARIERVVLDYELKRDYQTFLNRPDRPQDADREEETEAFAAGRGLPVIDAHLQLPDLRIEYETPDGRHETRDLELVTEHYSRSQMAGKAKAGFGLYKAAGAGRLRGSASRTGGTPFDPHLLERL